MRVRPPVYLCSVTQIFIIVCERWKVLKKALKKNHHMLTAHTMHIRHDTPKCTSIVYSTSGILHVSADISPLC